MFQGLRGSDSYLVLAPVAGGQELYIHDEISRTLFTHRIVRPFGYIEDCSLRSQAHTASLLYRECSCSFWAPRICVYRILYVKMYSAIPTSRRKLLDSEFLHESLLFSVSPSTRQVEKEILRCLSTKKVRRISSNRLLFLKVKKYSSRSFNVFAVEYVHGHFLLPFFFVCTRSL